MAENQMVVPPLPFDVMRQIVSLTDLPTLVSCRKVNRLMHRVFHKELLERMKHQSGYRGDDDDDSSSSDEDNDEDDDNESNSGDNESGMDVEEGEEDQPSLPVTTTSLCCDLDMGTEMEDWLQCHMELRCMVDANDNDTTLKTKRCVSSINEDDNKSNINPTDKNDFLWAYEYENKENFIEYVANYYCNPNDFHPIYFDDRQATNDDGVPIDDPSIYNYDTATACRKLDPFGDKKYGTTVNYVDFIVNDQYDMVSAVKGWNVSVDVRQFNDIKKNVSTKTQWSADDISNTNRCSNILKKNMFLGSAIGKSDESHKKKKNVVAMWKAYCTNAINEFMEKFRHDFCTKVGPSVFVNTHPQRYDVEKRLKDEKYNQDMIYAFKYCLSYLIVSCHVDESYAYANASDVKVEECGNFFPNEYFVNYNYYDKLKFNHNFGNERCYQFHLLLPEDIHHHNDKEDNGDSDGKDDDEMEQTSTTSSSYSGSRNRKMKHIELLMYFDVQYHLD